MGTALCAKTKRLTTTSFLLEQFDGKKRNEAEPKRSTKNYSLAGRLMRALIRSSIAPSLRSLLQRGDASALSPHEGVAVLLEEGGRGRVGKGSLILSCLPLPPESGYVNEPQ